MTCWMIPSTRTARAQSESKQRRQRNQPCVFCLTLRKGPQMSHHRHHKHKKYHWKLVEKALPKQVKKGLPNTYGARIFEVTSGDSGKVYWVWLIHRKHQPARITLCDCRDGYFKAPLSLLGQKEFFCKHIQKVRHFLKKMRGTKHDKES
jgi:hypothetical protein